MTQVRATWEEDLGRGPGKRTWEEGLMFDLQKANWLCKSRDSPPPPHERGESSRIDHVSIRLVPSADKLCVSEQGSPKTRQCLPFLPVLAALLGMRPNLGGLTKHTSWNEGRMWDS